MNATPDNTFADPEQITADLRRQLAEREAELAEALEQQTATAEVLQVINASPGDLTPVFDAMLENAMRLCEIAFGLLYTLDGEYFRAVAARGVPPALAEYSRHPFKVPPGSTFDELVAGASVVQIPDVATDDRPASDARRALVELGGGRTGLAVALRKDDEFLGALWFFRQEVRPFTDRQIALLQNFAAQAVIAMENARLVTETREALEQQTATAEVLQVINSSPGDLTPVFAAMLEKALNLCNAAFGLLSTYDGEVLRPVALRNVPEAYRAHLVNEALVLDGATFLGQAVLGRRVVHIADNAAEEPYRNRVPMAVAAVELGGSRTFIHVPLIKDDIVLGLLTAFRQEVRPFSNKQIALLQNFAGQAVIAMDNARLLNEQREALEQQTATAEVLAVINASPGSLTPVFDAMLEKAMGLCGAAIGGIYSYDGQWFNPVALRGVTPAFAAFSTEHPVPSGPNSAPTLILETKRPVQIQDLTAYSGRYTSGMTDLGGIRALLDVPLLKDGNLLGFIAIYREKAGEFPDKQIALLENFAAQAVIAMENARLLSEQHEALEQQTATTEVLQVINASPGNLPPVYAAMLDKAMHLCGAAFGSLTAWDGKHPNVLAMRGFPPALAQYMAGRERIAAVPPVIAQLAETKRPQQLADVMAGEGYRNGHPISRAVADLGGARTILHVPLRKDHAMLGYISVYRQEVRAFTDKQITLLENFAAQAVIAMENARLLGELRQRTEEVAELNRVLEARVAAQVEELGRVGRLKRFLAPQLAELIVSQGNEKILESHRREIVVVFCDLRGYTAFTETAEPEEVLDFLRDYHGALGPLVAQFEGTLDQFSGDGIMVFFNDPVPIPDPATRAVNMAVAMRGAAGTLIADWRERGRDLGFGAGIAQGYATLGQIGFSERSGYTAIGTVCNVAARLCAEAKDGQILLSQRVNAALRGSVSTEQVGALALKGLSQPVLAYNVPSLGREAAFRVIEGGAPNA